MNKITVVYILAGIGLVITIISALANIPAWLSILAAIQAVSFGLILALYVLVND